MSFSNKFYSKSMDLYGINAIENQTVTLPPHLTDYFNAKMPGETSIEKSENKPMDVAPPTATSKICGILHFSHLWEVVLFWEIFLPSLGLALFFGSKCCRKSKNDSTSWVWLYCVIHANLSVWIWFAYFIFTYNYCWQEIASYSCPDCSTVACTGGIFLGIALVISIIAAIANDQYYPDARMTPREAKNFFAHLKLSHPELTVALRSHLNSMGDWTKVKKVFFPRQWYDDTVYPDIGQSLGNKKAVVFKVNLSVYAKSMDAKDDLRAFVWDFGQEHNQTITLEDVDDYIMHAAIHPAQVTSHMYYIRMIKRQACIF